MRFGGFIKNSLIDYPGKISAVIFFKGCNYRCPYCHNKDLVFGPGPIAPVSTPNPNTNVVDESFVLSFLEKRKKFIDGVVLSGGEPTLAKSLVRICQTIKSLGFLLKIDTNGSYPDVLENLMYHNLIDYIAMDIKTSLDLYNKYITMDFNITKIQNSIDLIMHSSINYEFRTTCIKPVVDEKSIIKILESIKGAKKYVLQKCVAGKNVLNPEFMKNNAELYEYDQLNNFKKIALNMVETCILRA